LGDPSPGNFREGGVFFRRACPHMTIRMFRNAIVFGPDGFVLDHPGQRFEGLSVDDY
jgi:hypothetical protein